MELGLKPLYELITIIQTLGNGGWLYLSEDYPWNLDTLGLIFDAEIPWREQGIYRLEEINPKFVEDAQIKLIFYTDILEDVIWNAKFQKSNVTVSEIVDAFNYYYKYDAFMTIK